ncbi:MAG TPA: murein L,D-transpeptidase catalytic domain family protein [Longimicrobiales bacterium]
MRHSLIAAVLGTIVFVPAARVHADMPSPFSPPAPLALFGEPAEEVSAEVAASVSSALSALRDDVRRTSHDDALRMAFTAYYKYHEQHPSRSFKPYLYFVDYGLDNQTPRGYVFDMQSLTVVDGPFIVAHGRGSSKGKNGVPTRFSNVSGSASTSLGLYVAGETYDFTGKSGGVRYSSIGMRMDGVSGRYNSNARARGVVVHGAPYVTASGAGRSEGCPAMEQFRARRLIPMIANGGLVFLFSPRDMTWMDQDPWASV